MLKQILDQRVFFYLKERKSNEKLIDVFGIFSTSIVTRSLDGQVVNEKKISLRPYSLKLS